MQISLYYDVIFLLNLYATYWTYKITALLCRKKVSFFRMITGAGISSFLFVISLFVPWMRQGILGVVYLIGVTVGASILVFGKKHVGYFWFYSTTTMFLIGSIMNYVRSLIKASVFTLGKWMIFFSVSMLTLIGVYKTLNYKRKNIGSLCPFIIKNEGVSIVLNGFLDTGNLLKDSYTGNSVILVQSNVLKKCVNSTERKVIEEYEKNGKLNYSALIGNLNKKIGFHELSYQCVGDISGTLLCIYVEEIQSVSGDCIIKKQPVAIVQDCLFSKKQYQAILYPEFIKEM